MRRAFRRIFLALSLVAVALVLIGLLGLAMVKSEPAYYRPAALSPQELERAARRVEDKLVEIRNVAAERRAAQSAAATGSSTRPAAAPITYVVTFTQDELNAFLTKWTELRAVRQGWEGHIERPVVALRPGEIILAAKAKLGKIDSVIGVHLQPALVEDQLALKSASITAGRLPLPRAAWSGEIDRLIAPMQRRLPAWQGNARFDRTGAANDDAIRACYARLLIDALAGRAADAVLLVPLDGDRGVPVRLTGLDLGDGSITLRASPLDAPARAEFLRRLKDAQ